LYSNHPARRRRPRIGRQPSAGRHRAVAIMRADVASSLRLGWSVSVPRVCFGATCGRWAPPARLCTAAARRLHQQQAAGRDAAAATGSTADGQPHVPIELGACMTLERYFGAEDVAAFATVSGDHNPIHLSDSFAATTMFGRPIAHGMLVASMFSTIFASNVPGSIYLTQGLSFKCAAIHPVSFLGSRRGAT
jgi:hypothetical protein